MEMYFWLKWWLSFYIKEKYGLYKIGHLAITLLELIHKNVLNKKYPSITLKQLVHYDMQTSIACYIDSIYLIQKVIFLSLGYFSGYKEIFVKRAWHPEIYILNKNFHSRELEFKLFI